MGATLLYLIPFALFIAPSFVAAGATLVFVEENPSDKGPEQGLGRTAKNGKKGQKIEEKLGQGRGPGNGPANAPGNGQETGRNLAADT